jgi:hypothetical protein
VASFETLDQSSHGVLRAAHTGARRLGHDYVGTEHLLAALIELHRDNDGVLPPSVAVWEGVREHVGERPPATEQTLPFTQRLQETLGGAAAAAEADGRAQAAPTDLAAAICEHMGSGAHLVLATLGADPDRALATLAGAAPADTEGARSWALPNPNEPTSASAWRSVPPVLVPEHATRDLPAEARALELNAGEPPAHVLDGGRVLQRPTSPMQPWVIERSGHMRWAYQAPDATETHRLRAALALSATASDLPKMLTLSSPVEADGWLLIDAQRKGVTLHEHLLRVADGRSVRLSPELYAHMITSVAETLQALHTRGLVHRGLAADNLILDEDRGRLLIGSLALAPDEGKEAQPSSGERYTAPECFEGHSSPASDQFALGVIALEIFDARGAAGLTAPVQAVLDRATRQRPSDRFGSIKAFGAALTQAVRAETPLTVADRLERLGLPWRYALAPAALLAVSDYLVRLLERNPGEDTLVTALASPIVAGVLLGALLAMIVSVRRNVRLTHRLLRLPSKLKLLIAGCVLYAVIDGPASALNGGELAVFAAVAALGALFGPIPSNSGAVPIALLRWVEARLARCSDRRVLAGLTLAAVLAFPLLDWLPTEVDVVWPASQDSPTAADSGALGALWLFRNGLYAKDYARACAWVQIPPARAHVPCTTWAPDVAALQSGDPIDRRGQPPGHVFGIARPEDFLLDAKGPVVNGLNLWYISPRDDPSRFIGTMVSEVPNNTLVEIFISREAPAATPEGAAQHAWFYEAQFLDGHFYVSRVDDCLLPAPGAGAGPVTNCAFRDEITPQQIARVESVLRAKGYITGG